MSYGEAKAYHWLYNTKAWQQRRTAQLSADPLCAFCLEVDRLTSATVADHIQPHAGDPDLFFAGDLQSLCKRCHDVGKARQERGGYDSACDLDGYPLDPAHPANQ